MLRKYCISRLRVRLSAILFLFGLLPVMFQSLHEARAADRLLGIHSARVMSQSMPWIAQEAGLFKKYDLDFRLIYIATSSSVTAAMLGGDAEIGLLGGGGIIRAFVQGGNDFVFIGGVKNILTHSILAKPEIKTPEDLKGKTIGVERFGSNPHYFATQALRRLGIDPAKDVNFIQSEGSPETLTALLAGRLDAATMTAPQDNIAISRGFHYVIYGPDLRLPFAAAVFVTRRAEISKRAPVLDRFMRAMAEAAKILHSDKEFTYKVLEKQLRLKDRKILDASYNGEIKALDPKLNITLEGVQAILDDVAKTDARAKGVKADDMVDRRFLDEMGKSGFFEKLWEGKR
jgi:ABC-type nitrate/sulfonate/bicarbonate transport system substrate-binding protein